MSENFTTCIGIVKSNADPAQHGRLQIYIPSIDSKDYNLEDLPWATYVTPFGGVTTDHKIGREQSDVPGMSSYGFWAIPKVGAQVLCGFMEGEISVRFWMGCVYIPELNRTLPQSIEGGYSELDESGSKKPIPHYQKNLTESGLGTDSIHYKTRGGYERSISHPSNGNKVKPTDNGYAPKPNQPDKADSQAVCLTSPGKHYFVMSDVDEYCRIRLKTTEGSQIIFDDTNERIYISTAKGKNWIELDESNGKVYIYSDSKICLRSKNDINLYSDENINIVAKHRVNIKSEDKAVNIEAKHDVRLLSSAADVMLTASRDIQLKTTNGPQAAACGAESSSSPGGKGLVYHWAEKGGSGTSSIKFDAAQNVEGTALLNFNMTAKSGFSIKSVTSAIYLHAKTEINYKTPVTRTDPGMVGIIPALPATIASPAAPASSAAITDHMVRPDHEGWVRDEDEGSCKTPRNKKFQG